jgi:hypothetical protein
MKISYHVRGKDRKKLAGAISDETGAEVKYLGAPTFAYEVGGIAVDKEGTLTGNVDGTLFAYLEEHGFCGERIAEPNNPVAMDGEDGLTIEVPLDGFTDAALDNLEKLVASKASLIKAAIGAATLPIERTEERLCFPWFRAGLTADAADAYSRLIGALCAAAKKQKRVTAKEKDEDNPKFAFRVFLIRLGFIGEEYRQARKILLMNLPGNSAFRRGCPRKAGESDE